MLLGNKAILSSISIDLRNRKSRYRICVGRSEIFKYRTPCSFFYTSLINNSSLEFGPNFRFLVGRATQEAGFRKKAHGQKVYTYQPISDDTTDTSIRTPYLAGMLHTVQQQVMLE